MTLRLEFILAALLSTIRLCPEHMKSTSRRCALLSSLGDAKSHIEVVNENRKEEDDADIAVVCSQRNSFNCHVCFSILRLWNKLLQLSVRREDFTLVAALLSGFRKWQLPEAMHGGTRRCIGYRVLEELSNLRRDALVEYMCQG